MKTQFSPDEEAKLEELLAKFKQDPQYELKQELGRMLMRNILSFTPAEKARYDELLNLLNIKP